MHEGSANGRQYMDLHKVYVMFLDKFTWKAARTRLITGFSRVTTNATSTKVGLAPKKEGLVAKIKNLKTTALGWAFAIDVAG